MKEMKNYVKIFYLSAEKHCEKEETFVLSVKKLFESKTKLNSRVKSVHEEKKNVCEFFSGKLFESKFKLNQHFRANYKENKTPTKVEDNKHNRAAKIF
jgi:hypothetical protein